MGDTPMTFVCPVARRNQTWDAAKAERHGHRAGYEYPPGHELIVLTGRRRPNPSRRRGPRSNHEAVEFACQCGHVGWSVLKDAAQLPEAWGYWVIHDLEDNRVEHKIAAHHPPGSGMWERAEEGIIRKVDPERFYVTWVGCRAA